MTVLIVAPGEYMANGGEPIVGLKYSLEPYDEGTNRQNRAYFSLVSAYFVSGLFSYPAKNEGDLHKQLKAHIGEGMEEYVYVAKNGEKARSKTYPPAGEMAYSPSGEPYVWGRLKSWSKYTKKQRRDMLDRLIAEMMAAGCNSRKFNEIMQNLGDKQ